MKRTTNLLPVKSAQGWQQIPAVIEGNDPANDEPEDEDNSDVEPDVADGDNDDEGVSQLQSSEVPYIKLYVERRKFLATKKAEIAGISTSVISNPTEHYQKLKFLRALCSETNPVCAVAVRKLAILSLAALFKDITPGYHIRELTDKEKAVKVAKETRSLRDFEQGILSNYQKFIGLLERYVQAVGGKASDGPGTKALKTLANGTQLSQPQLEEVAVVAMRCMCLLLEHLPHFNYAKQLVHAIVPRVDSKQCKGRLAEVCTKTLGEVFRERGASEANVEAVRTINHIAKSRRGGRLGAAFVKVLLAFKSEDLAEAAAAAAPASREERQRQREAKSKMSRKEKKHLKASASLDRELLAAQATESSDKRVKLQTELLQMIFSVYFRILKQAPHSHLLPGVLEGLARFAHMISVEYFTDLFPVLDRIMTMPHHGLRMRLHCVQTAFQVLSGQAEILSIDPRQFYCHLYQCLLELCGVEAQTEVALAAECLEMMLRKRRQVSVQRVMSFVKRVATVCLHQDASASSLLLLDEIKSFLRLYSCASSLLDADIVTSGVFQPEIGDPEYSHAECTSLWELTLLQSHYDVNIRQRASQLTPNH